MEMQEILRGIDVVAITGRRIDAPGSQIDRFPLESAPAVQTRIRDVLREIGAQAVVCSGACGADLLALSVAEELGIQAYVVLPFARERFRETSVVDRPGDWGPMFDQLIDHAQARGRLDVIEASGSNHDAYLDAVKRIVDEAVELTKHALDGQVAVVAGSLTVVAVWDGEPRGPDDITAYFLAEAQQRGFAAREVLTMPETPTTPR